MILKSLRSLNIRNAVLVLLLVLPHGKCPGLMSIARECVLKRMMSHKSRSSKLTRLFAQTLIAFRDGIPECHQRDKCDDQRADRDHHPGECTLHPLPVPLNPRVENCC